MGLVAFHVSALLFAWLEFSWPVALAMTLALIMFIYGMYKYGMRIYRRFALTGDGFITGKFEIGDDGTDAAASGPGAAVDPKRGIGELLAGTGISDAPPVNAPAPKKRTQEVEKIIGLVEPKRAPRVQKGTAHGAAASAAAPPRVTMGGAEARRRPWPLVAYARAAFDTQARHADAWPGGASRGRAAAVAFRARAAGSVPGPIVGDGVHVLIIPSLRDACPRRAVSDSWLNLRRASRLARLLHAPRPPYTSVISAAALARS